MNNYRIHQTHNNEIMPSSCPTSKIMHSPHANCYRYRLDSSNPRSWKFNPTPNLKVEPEADASCMIMHSESDTASLHMCTSYNSVCVPVSAPFPARFPAPVPALHLQSDTTCRLAHVRTHTCADSHLRTHILKVTPERGARGKLDPPVISMKNGIEAVDTNTDDASFSFVCKGCLC